MKTYLFYDIETSGLNKAFDQVLQFAAIRTDMAFNELERHEIMVQLRADVIPSPKASIVHRISLARCQQGIPEVEAMQQIHALLNTPNTISVGYNTLNFDDEFLRFGFYRNLLNPYTHQYANQCTRMDIYPLIIFYKLYNPEIFSEWPVREGKGSLKLEALNALHQWAEGQAHDAMVDVLATVALAKHLATATPMWNYLLGYFDKKQESQRLQQCPVFLKLPEQTFYEALLLEGKMGATQAYQAPVLFLGEHYHYKNQQFWLRLDLAELTDTSADNITATTWAISKKLAEPGFILPPSPRFLKHLSPERQAIVATNKQWLQENPALLLAIREHYLDYKYPIIPDVDVDAALYLRSFLSPAQQRCCTQFLQAPIVEKLNYLENFDDPDLYEQALRVIGRNYPHLFTNTAENAYHAYLQHLQSSADLFDYKGHLRYTVQDALQTITQLRQEVALDEEQANLLTELETYLSNQFKTPLITQAEEENHGHSNPD